MASILRPTLNRIPGVAPPLKQENAVKDLTKLTRLELLDMKERQLKLLANKAHLNRLPDKGRRISDLHARVLAELERRTNIDEAANMFSELNIAAKGQAALNHMEWSGHYDAAQLSHNDDPAQDVLDSDDEAELDPLRIIAQRTMHERQTTILPPEPKLITAADLAEIASFKADSPDSGLSLEANTNSTSSGAVHNVAASEAVVDAHIVAIDVGEKLSQLKQHISEQAIHSPSSSIRSDSRSSTPALPEMEQHVRYLVEKTESQQQQQPAQREKFKPYKTTVSNVHAPEKERLRKQGKHWEVTAATPPPIQHTGAKLLPLLDSVEIQTSYLTKLKELQEKQAAERLAARLQRLENRQLKLPTDVDLKTKPAFTAYRASANHIEGEQHFNEDDEVHDPLDDEKVGGGVTYTVYN